MGLKIAGTLLDVQSSVKSLGLIIDNKLKFTEHVNSLLKKSFINMKLLRANRSILSQKLKIQLSESLVLSFFNYSDFVFGPFLSGIERARIQRVQNSCCRLVCSLRKYR